MAEVRVVPPVGELLSVEEVARRYIVHAERRGRKKSTLKNVESEVRVHLAPFFGSRSVDSITPEDVLDLVAVLEDKGLSPKSIQNIIVTLSGLFNFAKAPQRRWTAQNPCEGLELPAVLESEEIRFLTLEELDALAANAREGMFQAIDRALYRTAAMTGLRQGELLALTWADVDFVTSLIQVRRNYTDGTLKIPKGKKVGSVPMVPDVADALAGLKEREHFTSDHDLVFVSTVGAMSATGRWAGATTRRSTTPAFVGSGSTTSGTRSGPWRSASSTRTPCRPTCATPTTPRHSATCITSRVPSTPGCSKRRSTRAR
jgi:integrase